MNCKLHNCTWKSKEILREGAFNLKKFITNSAVLQQKIGAHDEVRRQQRSSPVVLHSEETYSKSTVGIAQSTQAGEQTVLQCRCVIECSQGSTLFWIH